MVRGPKMGRNLREEEGGGQGGSPELSAPFQFPWETISFCYFIFFREIRAFSSFGFKYFIKYLSPSRLHAQLSKKVATFQIVKNSL